MACDSIEDRVARLDLVSALVLAKVKRSLAEHEFRDSDCDCDQHRRKDCPAKSVKVRLPYKLQYLRSTWITY